MSRFQYAAQELIYAKLAALDCNVFDSPPDQDVGQPASDMPYVVIGHDSSEPFSSDGRIGEAVTVELKFWSAYKGKAEVKALMADADRLLNRATFVSEDYHVVDCLFTFSTIPDVGASSYVQGISRYRLTIEEQSNVL